MNSSEKNYHFKLLIQLKVGVGQSQMIKLPGVGWRDFRLHSPGCNLSGGIALIVWFTTNGVCRKNKNIYTWREQAIIREIAMYDLYYCLLPWRETLCTCRSGFPMLTKWCCDQDVEGCAMCSLRKKNVRSVRFVVKRRGCCCNLYGGVALNMWFIMNGMCTKNKNIKIATHDRYCCLLPECEALRTCYSGFLIATVP